MPGSGPDDNCLRANDDDSIASGPPKTTLVKGNSAIDQSCEPEYAFPRVSDGSSSGNSQEMGLLLD